MSRRDQSIEADALFLGLAQATLDCVAVLDARGVVRFASPRALEALGDQVAVGRLWADVWGREHAGEVDRALAAARLGEPARLRTFRTRPGQSPEWWDTTLAAVPGGKGWLMAAARNITADIEARSLLETLVDHVPAALFAKDVNEGRYIMINQAAEAFFGRTREEILGRTPAELFPPEEAAFIDGVDREVLGTGRVVLHEAPHVTAQGERIFKTRVMATFGDEGPRHIIGVSEDVTDERGVAQQLKAAADRAEAANRSKSEFLANMSHEIRTPLNGVVAVADVLARTHLDPQQREMVEIVRASGATLDRLLSDVLDLARIESGAIEIQSEPFQLGEAVRGVAGLLAMRAQEKGVTLDVAIAPDADTWVLGDVVRLKQILTNLTSNAVKFTDRGAVWIEVTRTRAGGVRLAVRDTGVGFDPAQKARVFGRFQQADGSITRRFGGTGLGLAISRELAELMGGALDCDSAPGFGSVFWATLPLEETAAATPAAARAACADGPETATAEGGALRVLLADDHPTNRKVVELILQPLGVDLVSVEDGRQALDAFAAGGFDVVLMDMQMPVMDGLAATRAIRQLERETGRPRTPVFMLTANALAEHLEQSRRAGADRHLAKPITAERLMQALAELDPEAADPPQAAAHA